MAWLRAMAPCSAVREPGRQSAPIFSKEPLTKMSWDPSGPRTTTDWVMRVWSKL